MPDRVMEQVLIARFLVAAVAILVAVVIGLVWREVWSRSGKPGRHFPIDWT